VKKDDLPEDKDESEVTSFELILLFEY